MRVAVGADHAGTPLNEVAIAELRRLGHDVVDLGTHDPSQPKSLSASQTINAFATSNTQQPPEEGYRIVVARD